MERKDFSITLDKLVSTPFTGLGPTLEIWNSIGDQARTRHITASGRNSFAHNQVMNLLDRVLDDSHFQGWLVESGLVKTAEDIKKESFAWGLRNYLKVTSRTLAKMESDKGEKYSPKNALKILDDADVIRGGVIAYAQNYRQVVDDLSAAGLPDKQISKLARQVYITPPEVVTEKVYQLSEQFPDAPMQIIGRAILRSPRNPQNTVEEWLEGSIRDKLELKEYLLNMFPSESGVFVRDIDFALRNYSHLPEIREAFLRSCGEEHLKNPVKDDWALWAQAKFRVIYVKQKDPDVTWSRVSQTSLSGVVPGYYRDKDGQIRTDYLKLRSLKSA